MSRSATVTLQFVGDTTQVDQAYEAFVRKASKPIAIPLTGGAAGVGAPAGNASTTFANASVPGAVPAPAASGAAVGPGDAAYQQAVNRLAAAMTQQAQVIEQGTIAARTTVSRAAVGGDDDAMPAAVGAPGQGAVPVPAAAVRAASRGGGWLSRLGRVGGMRALGAGMIGYAAAEALSFGRAYQDQGIAERTSVSGGGQVDLMRQLPAQMKMNELQESVPLLGPAAGMFKEWLWGDKEAIQSSLASAQRGDRVVKSQEASRLYYRSTSRDLYAMQGEGDQARAMYGADADRLRRLDVAQDKHNEQVSALTATGAPTGQADRAYAGAKREIEQGFLLTVQRITAQYRPMFQRIADDIPALAARADHQTQRAGRLELEADVRQDVDSERNPELRQLKRERGGARLAAYDAENDRENAATARESMYMADSYRAAAMGDESGTLRGRQMARRVRVLESADFSSPGSAFAHLQRQTANQELEGAENRDLENLNYFRTSALRGGERSSSLAARGQNLAARAQGIYDRGELEAEHAKRGGQSLEDQSLILSTALNDMRSLKLNYQNQGGAEEFGAGSLAGGGTQGNVTIEDMGQTMKLIDQKMADFLSEIRKLTSSD